MEVGISAGSNLGDRLAALTEALRCVAAIPGVRIAAVSSVYETEPVDVPDRFQDRPFLNAAAALECELTPARLAAALHGIEKRMGRVRGPERNAPRPIDLDIIYAGRRRIAARALRVPHPRWAERRFVVAPLAEIRPELIVPGQKRPVREILESLPKIPRAKRWRKKWCELGTERTIT